MSLKLDSINLFVKEMSKTLDFYQLLGFKFTKEDYKKNYIKVDLEGISLCFYSMEIVQEFFTKSQIGSGKNYQYELSFRVNSPSEVNELYEKIVSDGYNSVKEPLDSDWKQRTAFITDPDNNLIELCAFLEE